MALQELKHTQSFRFTSSPSQALVTIDGQEVGKTPIETAVTFQRESKQDPWKTVEAKFVLRDHETETIGLDGWANTSVDQKLELLRDQVDVSFTYLAPDGRKLSPVVSVDGEMKQDGADALHFEFVRGNKTDAWSTHLVKAEVPGIYVPKAFLVERSGPATATLTLEPLTELDVPRNFPVIEMSATGAALTIDTSARVGTINMKEQGEFVQGLSRITRFDRYDTFTDSGPVRSADLFASHEEKIGGAGRN